MIDSFDLLASESEEGPWVLSFPVELSNRMAQLTLQEIKDVCLKWAQIEEFYGMADPEELEAYLSGLGNFFNSNSCPYCLLVCV